MADGMYGSCFLSCTVSRMLDHLRNAISIDVSTIT
jgi:hypothetical protein